MPLPADTTDFPATVSSIAADLTRLGVEPGMVLVVHSSLSKLGWVNGGPVAVIQALEEVLTPEGTLVMPTHSSDLSDPAHWVNPPIPESWWQTVRDTMPAFDPALTPTSWMGIIPETFRKQTGVVRSNHPQSSLAAWGSHARAITAGHGQILGVDEHLPLDRVYDLGGWVLLLGVGHGNNTSLHIAEGRAKIPRTKVRNGAPILVDGVRMWVAYDDVEWDESDFVALGADFARETGLQREGKIARADALLMPQRPLIDYGVTWLERQRNKDQA